MAARIMAFLSSLKASNRSCASCDDVLGDSKGSPVPSLIHIGLALSAAAIRNRVSALMLFVLPVSSAHREGWASGLAALQSSAGVIPRNSLSQMILAASVASLGASVIDLVVRMPLVIVQENPLVVPIDIRFRCV